MKKRETNKIVYLFALIINLTLFNYANKLSDHKEQVNINKQYNSIELTSGDNFTQFEKTFPMPPDLNMFSSKFKKSSTVNATSVVLLEISKINVPLMQKQNEFISVD